MVGRRLGNMEHIKELKEEAYKIATNLKHPGYPEYGYTHDTNTRLKAIEVYARLISAEQYCMKENDNEKH
jgi:hypothetical protein